MKNYFKLLLQNKTHFIFKNEMLRKYRRHTPGFLTFLFEILNNVRNKKKIFCDALLLLFLLIEYVITHFIYNIEIFFFNK